MKTELIASDLDGTLLNAAGLLPEGFFDTIRTLEARGLRFAAASGRQYANVFALFEPVADSMYFIAENGSLVYQGRRRLISHALPGAFFAPALAAVRNLADSFTVLCGETAAYVEDADPLFLAHAARYYERLERVTALEEAFTRDRFCKVAVFNPDAAREAEPGLRLLDTATGGPFRTVLSGKTWVDLMIPGVDKGRALSDLLALLKIPPAACIVFGDYLNDLELMRTGAESVAMANAHPLLKAVAARETLSNDDDGVRVYLRKRGLL